MKVNFAPRGLGFFPSGQDPSAMLPASLTPAQPATGDMPDPTQFVDLDPDKFRQDYATKMLQTGTSNAPVRGGWAEGLARMGEAVLGGYFKHNADEQLKKDKQQNTSATLDRMKAGDFGSLITSDDPVAQKLGSAILEQEMKKKGGSYVDLDGTKVWQPSDGSNPVVIQRPLAPKEDNPPAYRWNKDKTGQEFIPGGPADPEVIKRNSGDRRAPKVVKPDQSGVPPWQRKW